MTSSGKVRIYELSKDLGSENKDVLDAAEKLSITAKSHSSSISDDEAGRIRLLKSGKSVGGKSSCSAKLSTWQGDSFREEICPPSSAAVPPSPAKPAPAKPAASAKPAAVKPAAVKP